MFIWVENDSFVKILLRVVYKNFLKLFSKIINEKFETYTKVEARTPICSSYQHFM